MRKYYKDIQLILKRLDSIVTFIMNKDNNYQKQVQNNDESTFQKFEFLVVSYFLVNQK